MAALCTDSIALRVVPSHVSSASCLPMIDHNNKLSHRQFLNYIFQASIRFGVLDNSVRSGCPTRTTKDMSVENTAVPLKGVIQ